jgi:hypothetical protein
VVDSCGGTTTYTGSMLLLGAVIAVLSQARSAQVSQP